VNYEMMTFLGMMSLLKVSEEVSTICNNQLTQGDVPPKFNQSLTDLIIISLKFNQSLTSLIIITKNF